MRPRDAIAAVITAAVLVTTAACTDGSTAGGPTALTSPVTTHPATMSSSPAAPTSSSVVQSGHPPTMLAEARQKTNGGAGAFAAYWVQATNWAYTHTDPSLLAPLAAARCTYCAQTVSFFRNLAAEHEFFVGGQVLLQELDVLQDDHQFGADLAVDVTVHQQPFVLYRNNRTVAERLQKVLKVEFRLWLSYRDSHWLIVQRGRAT